MPNQESKSELVAYYTHYTKESLQHKYDPVKEQLELPSLRRLAEKKGIYGNVLGAGCGDGTDYRLVEGLADSFIGVDLCPTEVQKAREKHTNQIQDGNVQFGVSDLSQPLPFFNGTYDAVVSFNIPLSHIDNPFELSYAAQELFRVLKSGGKAIIQLLNSHSICSIVNEQEGHPIREYQRNGTNSNHFHVPAYYHTPQTIDKFFCYEGFKGNGMMQRSVLFGRYTPLREVANRMLSFDSRDAIEIIGLLESARAFYCELGNPMKSYQDLFTYINSFIDLVLVQLADSNPQGLNERLSEFVASFGADASILDNVEAINAASDTIETVRALPKISYQLEEKLMNGGFLPSTKGGHTLIAVLAKP